MIARVVALLLRRRRRRPSVWGFQARPGPRPAPHTLAATAAYYEALFRSVD